MITRELELLRPSTTAEAVALLAERGEDITVLAGGMSLLPMMNLGIVQPDVVMSLNHVSDLSDLTYDGQLRIGATVRHRQVMESDLVNSHSPMLAEAAGKVGDVQVRNRGTMVGSLCHADPACDYSPVIVVAGAEVELVSAAGTRRLPADEFLIDLMFTARELDELVTAVIVPSRPSGAGSAFVRFARVEGSFAIVNAAAVVEAGFGSVRVAIGGVGPIPVLVEATDAFADGPGPAAFEELAARAYDAAEYASADIHSDAEYRRHMAGVFARRAVQQAIEGM